MRVLVTGGAGFIGSALCRALLDEGHDVACLDALTYAANPATIDELRGDRFTFVKGDTSNLSVLTRVFYEFQPNRVAHLAAETHVDRSIDDAEDFLLTNILGTHEVLTASRQYLEHRKDKEFLIVHVSTDEVFGSVERGRFSEFSPYRPSSPYAASKAASDHLVRSFWTTHGLPTCVVHPSNCYGPRQFPEKLIPLTIISAIEEAPIRIYGSGRQVRDWLHVSDAARAIAAAVTVGAPGHTYLLGGSMWDGQRWHHSERTNLEVIHSVCDAMESITGHGYRWLTSHVQDRPGHDQRYSTDASTALVKLNWQPTVKFDEGIKSTVMWYAANADWWQPMRQRYGGQRLGLGAVA